MRTGNTAMPIASSASAMMIQNRVMVFNGRYADALLLLHTYPAIHTFKPDDSAGRIE